MIVIFDHSHINVVSHLCPQKTVQKATIFSLKTQVFIEKKSSLCGGGDKSEIGASFKFWEGVRVGGQGGGDNSTQFINIGRVGAKVLKNCDKK